MEYQDVRVWCVVNPTGGGGKAKRRITPLMTALQKRFGARRVVSLQASKICSRPSAACSPITGKPPIVSTSKPLLLIDHNDIADARAIVMFTEQARDGTLLADSIIQLLLAEEKSRDAAVESAESGAPSGPMDAPMRLLDYVAVVGGDGTLGEVINGFFGSLVSLYNTTCGSGPPCSQATFVSQRLPRFIYLPAGTGADFARLGFGCRNESELMSVLTNPPPPATHRIDVGSVLFPTTGSRKYFINECSVGMSGDVIILTERLKKTFLRYLGGTITFFVAAIISLIMLSPKPYRLLRLAGKKGATSSAASPHPDYVDEEAALISEFLQRPSANVPLAASPRTVAGGGPARTVSSATSTAVVLAPVPPGVIREKIAVPCEWVEFPSTTVVFANGRFFGGGMMIAPHGDPTDQLLAITCWHATFVPFVFRLLSVYNGNHRKWKSTTTFDGQRFLIDVAPGASPQFCELDGELAEQLPAVVELAGSILMCTPCSGAATTGGGSAAGAGGTCAVNVGGSSSGHGGSAADQHVLPDEREPLLSSGKKT
jgi:diacylglycerol kinase family enzyme